MNKNKKDMIDTKSQVSSMRWALITCVQWSIILAVITVLGFFALKILNIEISDEIFGGVALLITPIMGCVSIGKATQYFAEVKENDIENIPLGEDKGDNKC
jgi:hypothetical protein